MKIFLPFLLALADAASQCARYSSLGQSLKYYAVGLLAKAPIFGLIRNFLFGHFFLVTFFNLPAF